MKKILTISLVLALALTILMVGLVACEPNPEEEPTETLEKVKVVDFDGEVESVVSPKRVAIYDYGILDILHNVGFENTGIEQLIVPGKDTLPVDLAWYKEQPDEKVVSGGSLFYVDVDVLDIVNPQLVILGGRAFGMNKAGERLGTEAAAEFKKSTLERYADATFLKLTVNSTNASLTKDIKKNVTALGLIFPNLKEKLDAKLAEITVGIEEIHEKAFSSQKTALFCMMVSAEQLSVFSPNSRFDSLYEDFGFRPVQETYADYTSQHGNAVSHEYVLDQNPDVIFVLDRSATVGTGAGYQNFLDNATIKATDAYKSENIYVLTGEAWYTMTGGFTATTRMISDINQFLNKQAA
ncbi:MAG: ABC transporter substrate-binding protein [Christensenellaceae bacterium]|jgi:iron complex transport system substrate-binding protein|nr:ABC transporter substrate-binding protein [Christensenellaceae bacterium]